jgi:hypothetical protein
MSLYLEINYSVFHSISNASKLLNKQRNTWHQRRNRMFMYEYWKTSPDTYKCIVPINLLLASPYSIVPVEWKGRSSSQGPDVCTECLNFISHSAIEKVRVRGRLAQNVQLCCLVRAAAYEYGTISKQLLAVQTRKSQYTPAPVPLLIFGISNEVIWRWTRAPRWEANVNRLSCVHDLSLLLPFLTVWALT